MGLTNDKIPQSFNVSIGPKDPMRLTVRRCEITIVSKHDMQDGKTNNVFQAFWYIH